MEMLFFRRGGSTFQAYKLQCCVTASIRPPWIEQIHCRFLTIICFYVQVNFIDIYICISLKWPQACPIAIA